MAHVFFFGCGAAGNPLVSAGPFIALLNVSDHDLWLLSSGRGLAL